MDRLWDEYNRSVAGKPTMTRTAFPAHYRTQCIDVIQGMYQELRTTCFVYTHHNGFTPTTPDLDNMYTSDLERFLGLAHACHAVKLLPRILPGCEHYVSKQYEAYYDSTGCVWDRTSSRCSCGNYSMDWLLCDDHMVNYRSLYDTESCGMQYVCESGNNWFPFSTSQ